MVVGRASQLYLFISHGEKNKNKLKFKNKFIFKKKKSIYAFDNTAYELQKIGD